MFSPLTTIQSASARTLSPDFSLIIIRYADTDPYMRLHVSPETDMSIIVHSRRPFIFNLRTIIRQGVCVILI